VSRETDIPFMIDRSPIEIASEVVTADKHNGTLLNLHFWAGEGAPPLMETLQMTCNEKPFDFGRDATSLVHFRTNGVTLELNWPMLLRRQIDTAPYGAKFVFRCEGVADAAGNVSQPHNASVAVQFSADKRPPAFEPPPAPTNAIWWAPAIASPSQLFTVNRELAVQQGVSTDGFAFVSLQAGAKDGMAARTFANPQWSPGVHRYLALSLRLAPETKITTNALLFELRFRPPKRPDGAKPLTRGAYLFPVFRDTRADNKILFASLDWKPGRWNDLMVDVPACLRELSGSADPFILQEFAIVMPAGGPAVLQVRAGAILAAWAPTDLLVFKAYDASGVAGIRWQGNGQAPHTAFRPALVKLPAAEPCWMRFAIRDRAGNTTPVQLVPIPPHAPAASRLPLSEDW